MRSTRRLPSPSPVLDQRPAVTVLAGFSPGATEAVARVLLVTDPGLLLVSHDVSRIRDGVVRRRVRTATTVIEDVEVAAGDGCLSCLVRTDVLPVLVRLSRERPGADIVLALPATMDPETLAAACAHGGVTDAVRFDSYVTVVDADRIADDLAATDDLRDRWSAVPDADDRSVADVAVRQIEYADTVVRWESPSLDRYGAARLGVLLHRLAPWATHVSAGASNRVDCTDLAARIRRTRRHDPTVPGMLGRAMEGFPVGVHEPAGDCGVVSVVFSARRPFHPQRVHDTLNALPDGVLRGRGQFWIASRPQTVIGYEHVGGGTGLDDLGHWLAALPGDRWAEATTHRRITADLDWDPYYGDRRTALAYIGLRLDADALTDALTACLLTDAEVADGFAAWTALPDPFAAYFGA